MKTIELVVSPTGEAKLETKGFTGDACREASAYFEAALGVKHFDQPTAESFTASGDAALQQPS